MELWPSSLFFKTFISLYLEMLSTVTSNLTEKRVLFLMKAGENGQLETLWNSSGNLSVPDGANQNMSLRELMSYTVYRNPIIDNWDISRPEKIQLIAYNDQGNHLWQMVFNVPMDTDSSLRNLLNQTNLISSSFYIVTSDTVIVKFSKPSYQLYVESTVDQDRAWFAVWDGPTGNNQSGFPIFVVPVHMDDPPFLTEESEPVTYTYDGCWSYSSLDRYYIGEDNTAMTIELCAGHCRGSNYPRMMLEMGYKCHCGDFKANPVPADRQDSSCTQTCNGADAGSPYICGGPSNTFAVYSVPDMPPMVYTYEGCYTISGAFDIQNFLTKPYMTVEMCILVCLPRNKPLSVLRDGNSCHCGSFRFPPSDSDRNDADCTTSCGGSMSFEACGGNNKGSVYQTELGTPVEELPNAALPSSELSISVASNSLILVNVSEITGVSPCYVTSVRVETIGENTYTYMLHYHPNACDFNEARTHTTLNNTVTMFSTNMSHELDVLPADCLWISFQINGPIGNVDVQISFVDGSEYIIASYLVLEGEWTLSSSASTQSNQATQSSLISSTNALETDSTTSATEGTTTVQTSTPEGTTTVHTSTPEGTTTVQTSTTEGTTTAQTSTTEDTTWEHSSVSSITSTGSMVSQTLYCSVNTTDQSSCRCVTNYIMYTEEELRQKIEYLKSLLKVEKETLSSYIRKRKSALDNRPSATSLGCVGALVIITVVLLVVIADISNVWQYVKIRRKCPGLITGKIQE